MLRDAIAAYVPQCEQEEQDRRVMLEYIDRFPDTILKRENEFAHITSSGFIVNSDASKVLFVHHDIYQVWAWTGGHADGEGDLFSVALREAREETGVVHVEALSTAIASLEILPVWGHWKRGRWVSSHQHLNLLRACLAYLRKCRNVVYCKEIRSALYEESISKRHNEERIFQDRRVIALT